MAKLVEARRCVRDYVTDGGGSGDLRRAGPCARRPLELVLHRKVFAQSRPVPASIRRSYFSA
jgi:hypothetical protein